MERFPGGREAEPDPRGLRGEEWAGNKNSSFSSWSPVDKVADDRCCGSVLESEERKVIRGRRRGKGRPAKQGCVLQAGFVSLTGPWRGEPVHSYRSISSSPMRRTS